MERLGSAKGLEIFERFRDLKKVENTALMTIQIISVQISQKVSETGHDRYYLNE